MSIQLEIADKNVLTSQDVRDFVIANRKFYKYSNDQDRKWALWSAFRYMPKNGSYGFVITRYHGSNQVILEIDGDIVYNNFQETSDQSNPNGFEDFMFNTVKEYVRRREALEDV